MKEFVIKVNGKEYNVEVEEVGGSQPVVTSATPVVAPKATPKATTTPKVQGKDGSVKVTAPMPGTILGIIAKPGDKVSKGDTIVILEAMKMENEIAAPEDGVVASINVENGAAVDSGQLLATLS